jgi:2-polyprenyl-3-methyl-5-hydroxy-6-metoxy-1,4-benzoquinol methylase
MEPELYGAPRYVKDVSECFFYHTMDLPGHGTVEGQWDLRGRTGDYLGGIALAGRRVLDVGTASGFLSFEMEKAGAEVVSFDADVADRIVYLPMQKSPYMTNRGQWRDGMNHFLELLKNSYWFAHRLHQSKNRVFYGDIYDLPEDLGMFDVAVIGQILVHLRDPITALASVGQRCADVLVVVEGMVESDDCFMQLLGTTENERAHSWWHLSTGLYREVMRMIGFEVQAITENKYRCNANESPALTPLKTLVARRTTGRN